MPAPWPASPTPPEAAYAGPTSPRTSRRHLAILARREGRLRVLDWGCGAGEYRPLVQGLGHRYVGMDADASGADVRGDAHRLPFRDAAFDHVAANAVLEHVCDPAAATREVARVLRPGGVFSGSAAFLEPYHMRSHFHLSPDGLLHVMGGAGLVVEGLWPEERWLVFDSLARMPGPVTAPTRLVLRALGHVERAVRTRHWHPRAIATGRWLRRRDDVERSHELLAITGQVHFLARKPFARTSVAGGG